MALLRLWWDFSLLRIGKPRAPHELQIPCPPRSMQPSRFWAQRQKQPKKRCVLVHSTHPKKMPHGNRKANGQGRRAQVVLPAFIGRSEDAQDQLEGEE